MNKRVKAHSEVKFEPSTCAEFESITSLHRVGLGVYGNRTTSPLAAYLALKSMFNNPDYFNLDEHKQQWKYFLKAEDACIEVYDWKRVSWNIGVYETQDDKAHADYLIRALSEQIARASTEYTGLISKLGADPAGYMIENPFALYYNTAEELLVIAQKLNDQGKPVIGDLGTAKTLCRSAFVQLIAAVEGLLNLISELYLRADLREERIIRRLATEQIDVKLRLLPIYCDCFTGKPLDHNHEALKEFGRIIGMRNDLIHANLTKGMKTPIVVYDDCTYYLPAQNPTHPYLVNSISQLGVEELKAIKLAIDNLIVYLIFNMNPRDKSVFQLVMKDDYIHVHYVDGMPVIQPEYH